MRTRHNFVRAASLLAGALAALAAAPVWADFPEDLEGELRLFAPAPGPPLAALGSGGEGTFRLEAGPGGDLRSAPGTAALTIPGGALRAAARDPFPVDYLELPLPMFGPIDWSFEWDAPPDLASVDAIGGFPFVSELAALSWNFQMLLVLFAAIGDPDPEDPALDGEAGVLDSYLPGARSCQRWVDGVVVVLPGCRPPGGGGDPVEPPTLIGDPIVSLVGLIEDATGLPVQDGCSDPASCIDLGWLTSALAFPDDSLAPVWLWTLGGAYDVVQASGRLAPYQHWLLFALGPELDRMNPDGSLGMVFLLVPPFGYAPPVFGTPLLHTIAADGVLAGAYGSESAESTCSGPDGDGDGMPDACDNCVELANGLDAPLHGEQVDADADGQGNACDCDFDQDGFCNIDDVMPFLGDFIAGQGDATDMNADGAVDISDFFLFLRGFVEGRPGPSGYAD